jgi:probable rRNA maturation factor
VTTGEPAAGEAVVEVRWAEDGAMAAGGDAALADRLERFGRRALHHLDYRVEVSVLLCDSATIRSLNERYRAIASPTDVLSFAQMEAEWPTALPVPAAAPVQAAGDVVIAIDVAARQAAARGEPTERELCRLLLHGMLHLVGMDHADPPREHEPMLTLQERTLQDLLGEIAPLGETVPTTGG